MTGCDTNDDDDNDDDDKDNEAKDGDASVDEADFNERTEDRSCPFVRCFALKHTLQTSWPYLHNGNVKPSRMIAAVLDKASGSCLELQVVRYTLVPGFV